MIVARETPTRGQTVSRTNLSGSCCPRRDSGLCTYSVITPSFLESIREVSPSVDVMSLSLYDLSLRTLSREPNVGFLKMSATVSGRSMSLASPTMVMAMMESPPHSKKLDSFVISVVSM